MKNVFAISTLLLACSGPSALAFDAVVRAGGSVQVNSVYWTNRAQNCAPAALPQSVSADGLPAGATISLQRATVKTLPEQCGSVSIDGAKVIVKVGKSTAAGAYTVAYTVTYSNGSTSNHRSVVTVH